MINNKICFILNYYLPTLVSFNLLNYNKSSNLEALSASKIFTCQHFFTRLTHGIIAMNEIDIKAKQPRIDLHHSQLSSCFSNYIVFSSILVFRMRACNYRGAKIVPAIVPDVGKSRETVWKKRLFLFKVFHFLTNN